ncbi:hypothetical protein [Caballeronia sp. LZ035]
MQFAAIPRGPEIWDWQVTRKIGFRIEG